MTTPMEKRLATCRVAKFAANEDGTYTFTVTTPAVDRVGDSVNPLGGDYRAFDQNPVVLYGHDYGELPIGRVESRTVSASGVTMKVRFASEIDEFAARVERYVAGGFLKTVSISFRPTKSEPMREGRGYRVDAWELLELSIVPVPCNSEALIASKGVGMVAVGEAKPPEAIDRAKLGAWAKAAVVAPKPIPEPEAAPAWVKALTDRLTKIEAALGLDEDNGDDPAADADADLIDPDEVDDSPDLTDALAAIDSARLTEV